jgi:hypothetical protein
MHKGKSFREELYAAAALLKVVGAPGRELRGGGARPDGAGVFCRRPTFTPSSLGNPRSFSSAWPHARPMSPGRIWRNG